jgi:hypothetical protein
MPVDSSLDFLQALEKSSLLAPDALSKVQTLCEKETDAKAIARSLIKNGALTKWQALQLLAGRYALTIGDYVLVDQVESDESTRVFVTRHPASGAPALLQTLARREANEDAKAVEQFVAKVEKQAAEEHREVLAVHRPSGDDQRCFVVVAKHADAKAAGPSAPSPAGGPSNPSPKPKEAGKDLAGGLQIGPIDTGKGPAANPNVGGFAIETGPKRRRKKVRKSKQVPASAKAPAGPEPKAPVTKTVAVQPPGDQSDSAGAAPDDDEVVVEIPKSPLPWLIGGAIVSGLLLVTGIILTLIFLFRGSSGTPELADAGGATPQEVTTTELDDGETDPELAIGDPEIDPVIAVVPATETGGEVDPEVPVVDPTPSVEADPSLDTTQESQPANESTPTATTADNASTGGPDTGDPAGMPATSESSPTTTPSDEPSEKPADEAETVEPPPAKPKPSVPNKKPFADLPKLLALPQPQDSQPKTLGSVYIPQGELCFVKLRGGVNACKGAQEIGLRNADGGLAERDWEISAKDGDAGTETKLAHLSVNDKHELTFQWQPTAQEQPLAAYLMNCALSFSCAGESHVATMRQPAQAEGLVVDFTKSVTKENWNVESCPEPDSIRLELTGVQGAKYTVEPAPIMEANNATAWVRIEDGGGMLTLKLETSMRRNLQVSVEPHIKPTPDVQPQKFSERVLKQYLTQATKVQAGLTQTVQMLQQALRAPGVSDNDKKRNITPRLALCQAELAKADTAVKDLQALDQLMTALSGNMRINFRVFYDADSSQVDLLQAGP